MKNQLRKKRRNEKAKKMRRDYERRRNINNNIPTIEEEERIPKFRVLHFNKKKKEQVLEHAGYKYKKVKKLNPRHNGIP